MFSGTWDLFSLTVELPGAEKADRVRDWTVDKLPSAEGRFSELDDNWNCLMCVVACKWVNRFMDFDSELNNLLFTESNWTVELVD